MPINGDVCRIYAGLTRTSNVKYRVSSYALLDNDVTDAHESHIVWNLNDVSLKLRQKQLTCLDCKNN